MTIGDYMADGMTRRDFLKTAGKSLVLGSIAYSLGNCKLGKDVSEIYEIKNIDSEKYLLIDGVPKVYELEKVDVLPGDGYDSLIFRHLEEGYNRMSSNNECRLPQILRDINGGELIEGRRAWGPTEVLTEEEFQELMVKYKKD